MESHTYTAKTVVLVQNVESGEPKPEHFTIAQSEVKASDLTEGGLLI
jgi:hypothetical protein